MSARSEVLRELAGSGTELCLALPRHLVSLFRRRARLRGFQALRSADPPPFPTDSAPHTPLRNLILSCGDASGEDHALRLLAELRRRHPGLRVRGFGGSRLRAAGMEVWEDLADLNVMGFRDVAARLPLFLRCVHRYAQELIDAPPDAVLLIDYPGLHRHLLRIAARRRIPVIDYIAPQLWAWAPWRVRDFRRADRLLTILPFESDWYARHGASAVYLGHPLGDRLATAGAEERPPAMDPARCWVGILPGSRGREIRENLPRMLAAAARLHRDRPEVAFVLPHLRASRWPEIDRELASSSVPVLRAPGCFHSVLCRLRAAWVTSGTALLEVAAHRVPPVLVYGISSRLGAWLARHALAVPAVGSLNLIAGRRILPEHLGRDLDPAALARDLEAFLDGPARERFLDELERILPRFASPGACSRAVRELEACVARHRNSGNG